MIFIVIARKRLLVNLLFGKINRTSLAVFKKNYGMQCLFKVLKNRIIKLLLTLSGNSVFECFCDLL